MYETIDAWMKLFMWGVDVHNIFDKASHTWHDVYADVDTNMQDTPLSCVFATPQIHASINVGSGHFVGTSNEIELHLDHAQFYFWEMGC